MREMRQIIHKQICIAHAHAGTRSGQDEAVQLHRLHDDVLQTISVVAAHAFEAFDQRQKDIRMRRLRQIVSSINLA